MPSIEVLPSLWTLVFSGVIVLTWVLYAAICRLYLHSLGNVPGPRLAALTYWYECYYDALLQGKYIFRLDELHKEYGAVVRVNPNEVHIQDSDFFDQFYGSTRKLDKDSYFYRFTDSLDSAFATKSWSVHRQRRKAFNRYFSPAALSRKEQDVRDCALQLCKQLESKRGSGKPVFLGTAFRALAADVISQYALDSCFDVLRQKDFGQDFTNLNRTLSSVTMYQRHFPWTLPALLVIPDWFQRLSAGSAMIMMLDFQKSNRAIAAQIAKAPKRNAELEDGIFHGICNSDLPTSDKTAERLMQETMSFIGAGTETTASCLEHTMYYVLANPAIHDRLSQELAAAAQSGDLTSNETLKQLPYLEACIKEGLRMGNEVSGRLPRIDPNDAVTYGKYVFPPGTVISMSIRDMHLDPKCHPDPLRFNPERFLDPKLRDQTERYFAPFNKGSRSCVGRELSWLEMRMTLALVVHRFKLTMVNTEEVDVSMAHDFFAPFHPKGSRGLQALVD
ncbi:Trichodiene oxygenase [Cyphellophora attinorum]|uniref:Trichodiene oxygenase n=1 Tax=Cyphellophora attinorum TaxID=1664694 RepID=A0A0N1NZG2_9EURO|nr:Trichodiene oxygenase [Phialophora attinorum]KPI41854.1 Trichodiene oxygenase [Phialophora attinorum]